MGFMGFMDSIVFMHGRLPLDFMGFMGFMDSIDFMHGRLPLDFTGQVWHYMECKEGFFRETVMGTGKTISYENKMVAICMLCFGFTMFERFAVTNLSPFIMEDLNMTNTQLGQIMSVFALAWALSGFFGSIFSDIAGNKKTLLGVVVICFSVCSLLTGLASTFIMLAIIRFVLGLFEGPVFPLVQAFSLAQSSTKRRGLNMGLISTTSMGLIANLIGPIVLVALFHIFGWRVTFFLTVIPGLFVAWLVFKVLEEPDMVMVKDVAHSARDGYLGDDGKPSPGGRLSFRDSLSIFRNRNVRTSMAFSCFIVSWNVALLTFTPGYLIHVKGFSPTSMSIIMAMIGVGAVVWGILVPGLSDRFGRKPVIIIFSILSIVSPLGLLLSSSGVMIGICMFIGWSGSGVFALYQSAILGESVDTRYASTAIASVQMTGELGGAVIGVSAAGMLADSYGFHAAFIFAASCMVIATLIALAYYETAPLVPARRKDPS